MSSPYEGKPQREWAEVTQDLIAAHPLDQDTIREVVLSSWQLLWETKIGGRDTVIRLSELEVPAAVVGYFLEKLVARELGTRFPGIWRGGKGQDEKDLVHVPDRRFSIEMKCSGQAGYRVYGNRSYGQELENAARAGKDKSGYYITANFFAETLTLIRFGWIDWTDWKPQRAPTGQMSGLHHAVYQHKLVCIPGGYQLKAPVLLMDGVGAKTASLLHELGVNTIEDLRLYSGSLPKRLERFRRLAMEHGP